MEARLHAKKGFAARRMFNCQAGAESAVGREIDPRDSSVYSGITVRTSVWTMRLDDFTCQTFRSFGTGAGSDGYQCRKAGIRNRVKDQDADATSPAHHPYRRAYTYQCG